MPNTLEFKFSTLSVQNLLFIKNRFNTCEISSAIDYFLFFLFSK